MESRQPGHACELFKTDRLAHMRLEILSYPQVWISPGSSIPMAPGTIDEVVTAIPPLGQHAAGVTPIGHDAQRVTFVQ